MASFTTNYNFKKPLSNENYSVEDQNGNMDIIDTQLKNVSDSKINISHTHTNTAGDGPQIGTAGIADNAITNAKMADNSVGTNELITGSVTPAKLSFDPATQAELDNKFNQATGHKHTGVAGDSPKIAAANITVADAGNNFTTGDVEGALTELFTNVSSGKNTIATAITGKGVAATGSDTFAQLGSKINSIQLATGNAGVGDVLAGKTFSNVSTNGATGTMPNNGAVTITPSTVNQTIPAGYHNGTGVVYGDADLIAANIIEGANIFGVVGTAKTGVLKMASGVVTGLTKYDSKINVPVSGLSAASQVYVKLRVTSTSGTSHDMTYIAFSNYTSYIKSSLSSYDLDYISWLSHGFTASIYVNSATIFQCAWEAYYN